MATDPRSLPQILAYGAYLCCVVAAMGLAGYRLLKSIGGACLTPTGSTNLNVDPNCWRVRSFHAAHVIAALAFPVLGFLLFVGIMIGIYSADRPPKDPAALVLLVFCVATLLAGSLAFSLGKTLGRGDGHDTKLKKEIFSQVSVRRSPCRGRCRGSLTPHAPPHAHAGNWTVECNVRNDDLVQRGRHL